MNLCAPLQGDSLFPFPILIRTTLTTVCADCDVCFSHYCDQAKLTEVTETHRCSEFLSLVVDGYSLLRQDFAQYTDDQLQTLIRRWATTSYDDSPDCRFTKYAILSARSSVVTYSTIWLQTTLMYHLYMFNVLTQIILYCFQRTMSTTLRISIYLSLFVPQWIIQQSNSKRQWNWTSGQIRRC